MMVLNADVSYRKWEVHVSINYRKCRHLAMSTGKGDDKTEMNASDPQVERAQICVSLCLYLVVPGCR